MLERIATMKLARFVLACAVFTITLQAAVAQTTVIHAGTLIAEPGTPPSSKQSIVVDNGRITKIVDGFVPGDTVIDLSRSYVLPGLIDMHTHVTGMEVLDEMAPARWATDRVLERQSIAALAAVPVVRMILRHGFTTIRNLGDPASVTYDLRDAIASGKIDGPRMLVSEPQFTTAGGGLKGWGLRMSREVTPLLVNRGECSGVDDCRRAVREEVERGADVIKIRLSDLAAVDRRIHSVEYQDELDALIETAHRLGRTVAVHTGGVEAETMMAVTAGADTLEHGPQSPTILGAMKRRGISFTPTLFIYRLTQPILKKHGITRDYYGETQASVLTANQMGVRILYGTDLQPLTVSQESAEFGELVAAGLTPDEALMAATVNASRALHMEDQIGSIAPGKEADIIAVDRDPLTDIHAMEEVSFVMKGGVRIVP
jgi:imidazolonepropionase-like amidohydrolase